MQFIETADHTRLFYKDWGTGQPVVFIHGLTMNADIWEYQMSFLAAHGLRCVAYDRRGHGRSSHPGHGYNYDTLADDLAAMIEQLDLRDVTLVSHSMGSGEIARYFSRHGAGRVARTVLVSTITPFLLKTADNPDGRDASVFDGFIGLMNKDRPQALAAFSPGFWGQDATVSNEMMQWVRTLSLQSSLKASVDCVRAFSETDFRPEMPAFTVPTLVVHGDGDQSVAVDLTGRRTAQAIPGSQLKVYEGASHALFLTEGDRFNDDLIAFLRD